MKPSIFQKKISQLYLSLVPFLTAIFGFGIGHISYSIYLPIWIINVVLMLVAAWNLGLHQLKSDHPENMEIAKTGLILMAPWIFVSIFFGFGPPPENAVEWTATATEQQIRYSILTIAGIFILLGFSFLRERLKQKAEQTYSLAGYCFILIAIPLFILNMLFWGFFLTETFRISSTSHLVQMPDWYFPIRKLFGLISVTEVALTYLSTASFAIALHKIGWFNRIASQFYIWISLVAFVFIILSAFLSGPFTIAGFAVSIPAIPFIMPYFMAVNLIKRAGK